MNLSLFMDSGIQRIAGTAARFYMGNQRGRAFLGEMAKAFPHSAETRRRYEEAGDHIPPFLIASIAASCNLRCAGCYAHANGGCGEAEADSGMEAGAWTRVFAEAAELGVSFVLLAGGEPLLRRDIIEAAARQRELIFPIFTNGTLLDESYLDLFDRHRNLIPVLSLEGDGAQTDARRGPGVAEKVQAAALQLKARGILYGVSITVTTENMESVTRGAFVAALKRQGCGLVFYVEYVPAQSGTEHLILDEAALEVLKEALTALRRDRRLGGMILLSFPGDEEKMGGCLAAGRGFFHINARGGAEPCPFSPVSQGNVAEEGLLSVLRSPFFAKVREISRLEGVQHKGGCTLFQEKDAVLEALSESEP